jgi:hypothetical protein
MTLSFPEMSAYLIFIFGFYRVRNKMVHFWNTDIKFTVDFQIDGKIQIPELSDCIQMNNTT